MDQRLKRAKVERRSGVSSLDDGPRRCQRVSRCAQGRGKDNDGRVRATTRRTTTPPSATTPTATTSKPRPASPELSRRSASPRRAGQRGLALRPELHLPIGAVAGFRKRCPDLQLNPVRRRTRAAYFFALNPRPPSRRSGTGFGDQGLRPVQRGKRDRRQALRDRRASRPPWSRRLLASAGALARDQRADRVRSGDRQWRGFGAGRAQAQA